MSARELDITGLDGELADAVRAVRDNSLRTVLITEGGTRVASVNPVRGELRWRLHVLGNQLAEAVRLLEKIRDHTLGGTVTAHDGTVLPVRATSLEVIHMAVSDYLLTARPCHEPGEEGE